MPTLRRRDARAASLARLWRAQGPGASKHSSSEFGRRLGSTRPQPGSCSCFPLFGLLLVVVGLTLSAGLSGSDANAPGAPPPVACWLACPLFLGVVRLKALSKGPAGARSRWFRLVPHHWGLTREGVMYVIIMVTVFVGALLGRSNLLLLVFGLLAGPFIVNGYVIVNMLKRNQVHRHLPERVMAGEGFFVDLTLVNRRRWTSSWLMVVEDRLQNRREVLWPRVLFTRVPPRAQRIGRYQVRLMDRGRYEFGPLRLRTRFPLGLVERSTLVEGPGELLVYPRLGRLPPQWRREQAQADELVQQVQSRAGTFDDEFHRLREYRAGDNPRAIHWRTSARRSELMVREYHQNRDQDLVVLLDLWQPDGATAEHQRRVELAASFAATLCVDHCRQSRESMLFLGIAGSETTAWEAPSGPQTLPPLLDRLAVAEPGTAAGLDGLTRQALQSQSPRARRVLVTTRAGGMKASEASEAGRAGPGPTGLPLRTVVADPAQLARLFEWDW